MSRYINPVAQYLDGAGNPVVNGKLFYFESEQNLAKSTFADQAEIIVNTNPVILDSAGRAPNIFYTGVARVVLQDFAGEQVWERDPVGDSSEFADFGQWLSYITYDVNDIVELSNNFYISKTIGNQGNDPSVSSGSNVNWTQIDLLGLFNTSTTYSVGSIVFTSNGKLWASVINSNLNHDPLTDADGDYWTSSVDVPAVKTTSGLIASNEVFAANIVINTSGYATAGDGAASWKQNGVTGQTVSQSPAQLGLPLLNDGNGNQWEMSLTNTESFETFALLQASTSGNVGQKLVCRERVNAEYIIQAASYSALTGDATLASGLVAKLQIKNKLNVLNFGLSGSNISLTTEIALNSGRSAKYYLDGSHVALTMVDVTTSNVQLDLTGADIDCINLAYDSSFNGGGSWIRFTGFITHTTTATASITAGTKVVALTSVGGAIVGDIVRLHSTEVDYNNGTAISYKVDINRIAAINSLNVTLDYPILRAWDNSAHPISAEIIRPIINCSVIGGTLTGGGLTESPLQNGRGQQAFFFFGVINAAVKKSIVDNMYANAMSTERCIDVLFEKNEITGRGYNVVPVEGVNSSWYGMYTIRSRNVVMSKNTGLRTRHTCDAAQCIGVTQVLNESTDSHRAAFGTHEAVFDCMIKSNTCFSGYAGLTFRAYNGMVHGNILIADIAITTSVMDSGYVAGPLSIKNNYMETTNTSANMYISGMHSLLSISNNEIIAAGAGIWLSAVDIINTSIKDNLISAPTSGLEIEDNKIIIDGLTISNNEFYNYTVNGLKIRGATNASLPAKNIKISNNTFLPVFEGAAAAILFRQEGYYGDGVIINLNTGRNDSSATVQLQDIAKFSSHPIVEFNDAFTTENTNRVIWDNSSATLADRATVLRGSIINKTSATSGQPSSYTVTSEGTYGTVTGVTGAITAASNQLVLTGNTSAKILPGQFINVAGSGGGGASKPYRVLAISNDLITCTLSDTADTTVSGEAVSLKAPATESTSVLS
jgi:hypothetical protein